MRNAATRRANLTPPLKMRASRNPPATQRDVGYNDQATALPMTLQKNHPSSQLASGASASLEPFSLVPRPTQQNLYRLVVRALGARKGAEEDHNDVAEIAAASALRLSDIVIAPSFAAGARLVRADAVSPAQDSGSLLAASLAVAVASLCSAPKDAVALISAGPLRDLRHWRAELTFAGSHKLPLLVLALTHPHAGSPDLRTLYAEIGLPVITVDAHDAIAVYRVTTEAAHNSRVGRGPTLIEAACIDHSRAGMTSPEPLASLESYMRRHGAWNENLLET